MGRQQLAVDNWFSNAKQSQQLEINQQELAKAQEEIERLTQEISRLREQEAEQKEIEQSISDLREQLEYQSGMQSIQIEEIFANPNQPRQTFLSESIDLMARSLDREGQLHPVILIEEKNKHYLLFDGERRWRAAKQLGWSSLKAVIITAPKDLHRKALLSSLHREDLNPLDKAEAINAEIAACTSFNLQEIPRILSTAIRRLNKKKQMSRVSGLITISSEQQKQQLADLELSFQEQLVLSIILDLQLNPASIDANIFPMLTLVKDLKQAIRQSGLKGVHAMALQTLNAKNLAVSSQEATKIRINATERVIKEQLSASQTRKLVKSIREQYNQNSKQGKVPLIHKLSVQLQKLDNELLSKTDLVQLQTLKNLLKQKWIEIEEIMLTQEDQTNSESKSDSSP